MGQECSAQARIALTPTPTGTTRYTDPSDRTDRHGKTAPAVSVVTGRPPHQDTAVRERPEHSRWSAVRVIDIDVGHVVLVGDLSEVLGLTPSDLIERRRIDVDGYDAADGTNVHQCVAG